jgi:8-oxoguanine deaminase
MLLQRIKHGAGSLSPTQALELGTLGGARLLRRAELGVIAPGKAADIIALDLNRLSFAGGLHDPVAALVMCEAGHVDFSMVNGVVRVLNGELQGIDLPALIDHHNRLSAGLVARTEKRYGITISTPPWRRAYPYDPRV